MKQNMNKLYEFNAEKARKVSSEAASIESEHARVETLAVLAQIEKSAKASRRTCNPTIPWDFREVIEKRLRELGYGVKYYDGDQREPGYYTISW